MDVVEVHGFIEVAESDATQISAGFFKNIEHLVPFTPEDWQVCVDRCACPELGHSGGAETLLFILGHRRTDAYLAYNSRFDATALDTDENFCRHKFRQLFDRSFCHPAGVCSVDVKSCRCDDVQSACAGDLDELMWI